MADNTKHTATDEKEGQVFAQLAEAQRRITLLEVQHQRLVETCAVLAAEVYCMEIGMALRENATLGPDGLRFGGGASRSTYELRRQQVRNALMGVLNGV